MAKGGRRSTTWATAWKSGKTTVIRVPEVLAKELLRIARVLDEGGVLPVTGNSEESDSHVTGNQLVNAETLKESANTFMMTIPPKERRSVRKLLYKFIDSHCSTSAPGRSRGD